MPPNPGRPNRFGKAFDCGLKPESAWLDSRPEIGQGYVMTTMLILD